MVKLKKYYSSIILLFLCGCASTLPPEGGEVDRVPPVIVNTIPTNYSTNFRGNSVEIEFSEYVDKRSFLDAIFISPSPEDGYKVSWSGTTAEIEFNSPLLDSVTYTISIGTDVVDYNNRNRMAAGFNFVFSTYDRIDNGTVYGKIFNKNPAGIYLYAFRDSRLTDFSDVKPDYVTQAGSDGFYMLNGLREGKYLIFAVKDAFRDLKIDVTQDEIGIPAFVPVITAIDTIFAGLNYFIEKYDTTSFSVGRATMTDLNHLILTFNKDISIDNINLKEVLIKEIETGISFSPGYIFRARAKQNEVIFSFAETISSETKYQIEISEIIDKHGKKTFNLVSDVTTTSKPDTLPVSILKIIPEDKLNTNIKNPDFKIYFDDGVSFEKFKQATIFADTSGFVFESEYEKIDDASFDLSIKGTLRSFGEYQIRIDFSKLPDAAGNTLDTIIKYRVVAVNPINYTGLNGKIVNTLQGKNYNIILKHTSREEYVYSTTLQADGNYAFENVFAGDYKLFIEEKQEAGEFFTGTFNPLKFPDLQLELPKVIELPARWSVNDFIIDLEECKKFHPYFEIKEIVKED
ncbi:MAG: Ig-like domain-containing protein [Ignavibacteriaceae bacterium]|nr:Ig-like domain-containing protein [Ignavibacteriaceae bacterium]